MASPTDSRLSGNPVETPEHVSTTVIPVLTETMEVERVVHQTGTVRVRKIVHHDAPAAQAPGFQESVEATRLPVNQVVEAAVSPHQRGDVLIIPLYEERWVRQLVLVEEMHVIKRRTEIVQSETVALRREELVVERLDSATGQWVPEKAP